MALIESVVILSLFWRRRAVRGPVLAGIDVAFGMIALVAMVALSSAVNLEQGLTHTSRKDKKPLKRIIYLIMSVAAVLGLGMAAATAASASAKNPAHLAAADESTLWDGQSLSGGQSLVNGSYTLAMQTDGNLVLYYGSSQALWQSHTYGHSGAWVAMQGDGNLVVYAPGNVPLWQSGTAATLARGWLCRPTGTRSSTRPPTGRFGTPTPQARAAMHAEWPPLTGKSQMPAPGTGITCARRQSRMLTVPMASSGLRCWTTNGCETTAIFTRETVTPRAAL